MKKVLYIGDDVIAGTGMALVSRHIIEGIKDQCELYHMAINYTRSTGRTNLGYRLFPAISKMQGDFQGYFSIDQRLAEINPDIVIVHNDMDVVLSYYKGVPNIEFEGSKKLKDFPVLVYPALDTQKIPKEWEEFQYLGKGPFSNYGPTFLATCKWAADMIEDAGLSLHPARFMYEQTDSYIKRLDKLPELKMKWCGPDSVDRKVFLIVSRNDGRKNISGTLSFLNQMAQYFPNMHVILKYFGVHPGGVRDEQLPQLCSNLGGRVTVVNKLISPQEVNELYNICDYYVNLTKAEGWGHGPICASKLGKPSILTNLPISREILAGNFIAIDSISETMNSNKTIWLEPDLSKESAMKLAKLLTTDPYIHQIGEQARE